MVNIYLFIELLHTANAVTTVDMLKAIQMENCKFANVVVLSDEKILASLIAKIQPTVTRPFSTRSPRSTAWCRPISLP